MPQGNHLSTRRVLSYDKGKPFELVFQSATDNSKETQSLANLFHCTHCSPGTLTGNSCYSQSHC